MKCYVAHYQGSRRQNWTTPRVMFDALNERYGFTLDGASEDGNKLVAKALTRDDILVSWAGERVFCNPPWSRIPEFVELAGFADLAVLLVPARVNARCGFHRALRTRSGCAVLPRRDGLGEEWVEVGVVVCF